MNKNDLFESLVKIDRMASAQMVHGDEKVRSFAEKVYEVCERAINPQNYSQADKWGGYKKCDLILGVILSGYYLSIFIFKVKELNLEIWFYSILLFVWGCMLSKYFRKNWRG